MTSKRIDPSEAFVWIWLPKATEPVVAGRLAATAEGLQFNYGRSYLGRKDAIPLYLPELPLQPGVLPLLPGLSMPGCLRDGAPDAWGRRVILNQLGALGPKSNTDDLTELTYLLESGSNRIGALDFQASASRYRARESGDATLPELLASATLIDQGKPLTAALARTLQHGTSIGGARPKVVLKDGQRQLIAKFSSSSDTYPVVKAEFIAMRLAALAGIDTAKVELVQVSGKDVLLVERFDRVAQAAGAYSRRCIVSALTLLGLDEMLAAYASYEDLAEIVRQRFAQPRASLHELFARLSFNILCGNTDDHARNHAAFWNGAESILTPAYDICPQPRVGQEATQAMKIVGNDRYSRLTTCLAAADQFQLNESAARAIIDSQIQCIQTHWESVCDQAGLAQADQQRMWQRQFLNPYGLYGYDERQR